MCLLVCLSGGRYLELKKWWDAESENKARDEERMAVLKVSEAGRQAGSRPV